MKKRNGSPRRLGHPSELYMAGVQNVLLDRACQFAAQFLDDNPDLVREIRRDTIRMFEQIAVAMRRAEEEEEKRAKGDADRGPAST